MTTRARLELEDLVVRDAGESATAGPGLALRAGRITPPTAAELAEVDIAPTRLDVDDVEALVAELDRFLEERGRRR